jgi:hypothetical protein
MGVFLWIYRQLYWCKRSITKKLCPDRDEYIKVTVHSDSLPWFWIGMNCPNGSVITVTEIVNKSIHYGRRVTPEFISDVTGIERGVWKYMDIKTLEEKDFPSEGFIIEDVLDKQLSDSE